MINGLRNMTYEQRLNVLDLTTIETRRMLRADFIQVYKILNNIDRVEKDRFLSDDMRGHNNNNNNNNLIY